MHESFFDRSYQWSPAATEVEGEDIQVLFQELVERFLGAQIDNRGYIPLHRFVRDSVKCQTPVVLANPSPPAAEKIVRVAHDLLELPRNRPPGGFFQRFVQESALV